MESDTDRDGPHMDATERLTKLEKSTDEMLDVGQTSSAEERKKQAEKWHNGNQLVGKICFTS